MLRSQKVDSVGDFPFRNVRRKVQLLFQFFTVDVESVTERLFSLFLKKERTSLIRTRTKTV